MKVDIELTEVSEVTLPSTTVQEPEYYTDSTSGKLYYVDDSGQTHWKEMDVRASTSTTKMLPDGKGVKEAELEMMLDRSSGRRYTSDGIETTWIDEEEDITIEVDDNTGRRYFVNAQTGKTQWCSDSEMDDDE